MGTGAHEKHERAANGGLAALEEHRPSKIIAQNAVLVGCGEIPTAASHGPSSSALNEPYASAIPPCSRR